MSLRKSAFAITSASVAAGEAAAQGLIGPIVNTGPAAFAGAGAALLGAAWITSKILTKAGRAYLKARPPELNIDEILPFLRIDSDNQTVICERPDYSVEGRKTIGKHDCRFVVIECGGVDYASTSPEVLESFRRSRIAWQGRLAECQTAAHIIFERRLLNVSMPGAADNEWLSEVNDRWSKNFTNAFSNRTYILLIDEGTADLSAALTATLSILAPAKPRILQHTEKVMVDESAFGEVEAQAPSELWRFLHDYVNTDMPVRQLASENDLPRSLKGADFEFDEVSGTVRVSDGIRTRYQKFVVLPKIERERIETNEKLMRQILMLNHELSVYICTRPRRGKYSKKRLREMEANRDISKDGMTDSMREEYAALQEDFAEGGEAFTETEVIIKVQGETIEAALRGADAVVDTWTQDENFRAAVATVTVMNEWERRFPGAGMPIREMSLGRGCVADWTPFEGTPRGLEKCWWGPHALRVVKTINGSAYHLGIHEHGKAEALGNLALIGLPGSGKTVTASWMITGALSYFEGMRVFAFDNLHGLSVPTRVFGGVVITPGKSRFAPLQMEDTPENRALISQLLFEMSDAGTFEDSNETFQAREDIENGLQLIMPLERHARTLKNFITNGVNVNSKVGRGLRAWVDNGQYAGWMDGDVDGLDLEQSNWITFDMTRLLGNPKVLSVYMAYVMHRIQEAVWLGAPQSHIIFMDEAPTMFAASPLLMKLGEYLARNIRKKKGTVWFAFQDAEGMGEAGSVIVNSCATLAFWGNPNVNKTLYQDTFNLSDSDVRFIADEDDALRHLERKALFVHKTSRGQESTPVNLHLGALGELMALFKSGNDGVDLANNCIREFGEERWIRPYIERFKSRPF